LRNTFNYYRQPLFLKTKNYEKRNHRREFISTATVIGAGLTFGAPVIACSTAGAAEKPAILGGPKAFTGKWSGWPIVGQIEQDELLKVLNSGQWCRLGAKTALRFEEEYKKLFGAKGALGVSSGTAALYTMLGLLILDRAMK